MRFHHHNKWNFNSRFKHFTFVKKEWNLTNFFLRFIYPFIIFFFFFFFEDIFIPLLRWSMTVVITKRNTVNKGSLTNKKFAHI